MDRFQVSWTLRINSISPWQTTYTLPLFSISFATLFVLATVSCTLAFYAWSFISMQRLHFPPHGKAVSSQQYRLWHLHIYAWNRFSLFVRHCVGYGKQQSGNMGKCSSEPFNTCMLYLCFRIFRFLYLYIFFSHFSDSYLRSYDIHYRGLRSVDIYSCNQQRKLW